MGYTRKQKRFEISREIALRRRVYPKMVAQGRMSQTEADHWIEIMTEIWADYADEGLKGQKELKLVDGEEN